MSTEATRRLAEHSALLFRLWSCMGAFYDPVTRRPVTQLQPRFQLHREQIVSRGAINNVTVMIGVCVCVCMIFLLVNFLLCLVFITFIKRFITVT